MCCNGVGKGKPQKGWRAVGTTLKMCNFTTGGYDHRPKYQVRGFYPGAPRLGKHWKPVIPFSGVPAPLWRPSFFLLTGLIEKTSIKRKKLLFLGEVSVL